MRATNPHSVPLGVLLIAGFYAFGAIVLLAGMVFNWGGVSTAIAERHGLPGDTGIVVLPLIAMLALAIAYGLYSLSHWGFFLTVTYLCYFGGVNLYLTSTSEDRVFLGNFVWSALVLLYLFLARRNFFPGETRGYRS